MAVGCVELLAVDILPSNEYHREYRFRPGTWAVSPVLPYHFQAGMAGARLVLPSLQSIITCRIS